MCEIEIKVLGDASGHPPSVMVDASGVITIWLVGRITVDIKDTSDLDRVSIPMEVVA